MTYPARTEPRADAQLVSRRDFLDEFADDYRPGQHVTLLGPTGRGKSTLCFQMLSRVISPDMQVVSLHGKIKGRDPVIDKAAKHCRLRVVSELPSRSRQLVDRKRKYNGYMLVPLEHPDEPRTENQLLHDTFKDALHQNYRTTKRKTITHINESHQVQHELGLKTECEAPLMRGGPDNAEWNEAQRGRYLSYHTYGAPEHIVIFYDDDKDTRQRYSDFGCADPHEIMDLTSRLKTARSSDGRTISQCLYIRRGGGMYIVDM